MSNTHIYNNSGINNVNFSNLSKMGHYIETNLGNKGIVVEEYLSYPEPCEWVLDSGYSLNEALMYECGEEIIKEEKKDG